MIQTVISGYGRMGRAVEKILVQEGIPCAACSESIRDIDPQTASASVCIDFTTPQAFRENYPFLARHFRAVVVGTTGWDDIREEVVRCFKQAGTPMIWASNFSVGVNVFFEAVRLVSGLLGRTGGYAPYLVEMHHKHKLDAPSGTARSLASLLENGLHLPVDIQSVRCGEIPGIHTVGLEGPSDRITLRHEAFSREGFARGAVLAARWTEHLQGVHEFRELLIPTGNATTSETL